jgi:hypothetical protein
MSFQVMYRSPQAGTNAAPVQYVQGGYEASFGTHEIDERAHNFSYHVEGALVRTLIGKDLKRVYDFSGKQLVVKSSSPDEHCSITRPPLQIIARLALCTGENHAKSKRGKSNLEVSPWGSAAWE